MISLPITESEKQRRGTDERARTAHRQAVERATRSKIIFPKTKNQQQQLPLSGVNHDQPEIH